MKPRAKVSATATTSTPDTGVRGATRVIDRYEIVAVIGRGVAGAVYRAVDTRLGRTVALKTATGSRDSARLTDRVRQRFLREAMALSKVDQRNVVQVLDYGFADDGTPFLVMEHLPGRDLGALLALAEGPLPVPDVAEIGLGVCAALRACHRVGIIHRDLKAADVFLVDTDTGIEIKVLDFGVSMAAAADDRTRQSQPMPASHHLAPEQIDGKVGPASDQYALGVLLHFCLTRRFPDSLRGGRGRSSGVQLPPGLEAVLHRATRMAPAERFESVYALGRELLDFASSRGQAQWRGYYRPQPDQRPAWAVLSPTKRVRTAGTSPAGAARAVTSTKVSRRPGEGPARATGTWPLRAATVGCVALAATGLTVSR
ncbi:MAG TPA: serine/threonine-protein kinase, partial [Polyangia bacterium]|nr:serine/threonine-protein kinase [Polyangia bacterium]